MDKSYQCRQCDDNGGPNLTIGFVSVRDSVYYAVGNTIPGS